MINMLTEEQVRPICEQYTNDIIDSVLEIGYDTDHNDQPIYRYILVTFCGGDNSGTSEKGKWVKYLTAAKELIEHLDNEFDSVWVTNLDVDCSDDVFYLTVAVKDGD